MADSIMLARGVGRLAVEAARAGLDRVLPGGEIPLRANQVTPRWLESTMGLPSGSIRAIEVIDENSGTAARAKLRLDVKPGTDAPERVFLKFTPHNYFQHVLMNVMNLGTQEVLFYRAVAPGAPVRVAHCYGTALDMRRGRNVMVLEDLENATFRDVRESLNREEAEAVVDAMAGLHAAFWGTKRFDTDLRQMRGRTPAVLAIGNQVRRRLMTNVKGDVAEIAPPDVVEASRVYFERSAEFEQFMAAQSRTVTHGDPHLGNLFFEGSAPGFIDWQVCTAAPGMRDVGYFLTASVDPDLLRTIEREMVERYVANLKESGIDVDFDWQWALYRGVGIPAFYGSAIAAATSNDRMQPAHISLAGLKKVVAAVEAHDSFNVLSALLDGRRV